MRKKTLLTLVAILTLAVPAFALFGLGDIVFDPTNFEEAAQQLIQLQQQYWQLVQTYRMVENQYVQMVRMAQQLPSAVMARYRTLASPWTLPTPPDAFGNTSGWAQGINSGTDVSSAYSAATERLGMYGSAWSNIPADQIERVKSGYATVELTDGANLAVMATLGRIRGNASANDAAISNLENDSLSSDPDFNTEIAVLNKINAAHVIGLRAQDNTNQLLAAVAEQQLIQAKRERDAEAAAFNAHIQFMSQAQSVMAAQAQGASQAMVAWRMP